MENSYNFKPYDKVLVRDDDNSKWGGDFFLRHIEGVKYEYLCLISGYAQCIPYEGNEHLLGTTNKPFEPKQHKPSQPESPQVENKKGGIKEDFDNYGYSIELFKSDDLVLCRDYEDEEWKINAFLPKTGYDCRYFPCYLSAWRQCIPYEGNEHLLGTTDAPERYELYKNTLFGIKLKPGYVLKLKNGAAGVLFPIREKAYPYKQKLAIIYSHGAWVHLEDADTTEVASIHDYSHGFALASGDVLWKSSTVQKLTKAEIAEKLGMDEQDFEIVEEENKENE